MGKKKAKLNIKQNTKLVEVAETQKTFLKVANRNLQKIVLFLISIIIYSASINFDYTLDDTLMITGNSFTKQGFSGIKDIMTNDALSGFLGKDKNLLPGGRYRPLSQVIFAIEYEIFGLKNFVKIKDLSEQQKIIKERKEKTMKVFGHSLNVLLYALLSILIFTVLLKLFKEYENPKCYASISFIASLLFVVHPLHTEITCNIKNVDELMSMIGSMSIMYFLLKYLDKKNIIYLAISSIIYVLSILSKEDSLTFLAIIPLTFYFFTKAKLKDHIIIFSPLLLGLIIYFLIRYNALGFMISNKVVNEELLNNPFLNTNFNEKYASILYTWAVYFKLLFIPYPQTHDYYPYHIKIVDFTNPIVIISALLWISLTIFALLKLKNKNIISYGILFFLITFSISSNLVMNIGAFMNERFVFIPLLGFTIIVAYFFAKKLPKLLYKIKNQHFIVSTIIILISLTFSALTYSRSFVWKNDFTLFTTDVKVSKNSAKCNVSAGGMIYHSALKEEDKIKQKHKFKEAIKYLEKGIEIHPTYIAGLLELGNVYFETKDYIKAKNSYERILKISSTHPNALNNILALAQRASLDSNYLASNIVFNTLLKYENKPDHLYSIAVNMIELNRIDTAMIILNTIIDNNPEFYKSYYKLGEVYGRYLKDINKADFFLNKAYSLKQDDYSVLENLGIIYGMQGKFSLSLEFFDKAMSHNPNDARIYKNIASTYYQMGNTSKAEEYQNKAIELEKKKK